MPDVIVIGSGPNGLVSACILARAGLDTLVVEAQQTFGGASRTAEHTLSGFKHDLGAGFFPFGKASPAFKDLDLAGAGLEFQYAPIDSAHPALDGSCGVMGRDLERCAQLLGEDGDAFLSWARWWAKVEDKLLPTVLFTVPPIRSALSVPPLALVRLARVALSSGRGFASSIFQTEAARRMLPALALHTDVGPSDPLGAIVGFMLAMTATTGGFAVPRGGASAIPRALKARLKQHSGTLTCGARVRKIIVDGARAVGVELDSGDRIAASVGIIADTAAPTLYLQLLDSNVVPSTVLDKMRSFRFGFGTFKMDWALSAPVPWKHPHCREAAVVHTGEDLDDLDRFTAEVRSGQMPERPYLVIGQQSLADASRAPAGKHTLYAYSRVPGHLAEGTWDVARTDTFVARIEQRIEQLAPGFKDTILARAAFAPPDLQAMNENLLHGDLGGGTADITNQLFLRPMFPYFRYRTPVQGLYLGSSYAHPGAGVHGMCGYNAAHALLDDIKA